MKQFCIRFVVALFCFAVGNTSNRFFELADVCGKQTAKAEIKMQKFFVNDSGLVAKFIIYNNSTKTLKYVSYGKNGHCSYSFHYEDEASQKVLTPPVCLSSGLQLQNLLLGEKAEFLLDVPSGIKTEAQIRTEFKFKIGTENNEESTWSNEFQLPYVSDCQESTDFVEVARRSCSPDNLRSNGSGCCGCVVIKHRKSRRR